MSRLTEAQLAVAKEFADMEVNQLSNLLAGAIKAVNPIYCGSTEKGAWTPLVESVPEIEDQIASKLAGMVTKTQVEDVVVILELTLKALTPAAQLNTIDMV